MNLFFLFLSTAFAAPLQQVLSEEMGRALGALAEEEGKVHYAALALETRERTELGARSGVVDRKETWTTRFLDVDLRVGTPELDSTHPLRGANSWRGENREPVEVAWGPGAGNALRQAIWKEIERRYRNASEAIVLVRADQNVKVAEENPAPDFSTRSLEAPWVASYYLELPPLNIDTETWESMLVELSSRLDEDASIEHTVASLSAQDVQQVFVDTDGTSLLHGRQQIVVVLSIHATAEDGDEVSASRRFHAHDSAGLPTRDVLFEVADELVIELQGKLSAPRGEPWSGPVLLSGESAGVFFHEVLGHRLEGHRQKRDWEGKTFLDRLGELILPEYVDIVDDPTLSRLAGVDLMGHYRFDNEGVRATRASLVEAGRLQGFLVSRSPLAEFPTSTGHGRRSTGNAPLSRMGNLVVEIENGESREVLRQRLRELAVEQGLEYGLLVDGIDGGFTSTGRVTPNAFNVRTHNAWRVWVDGREDERVRGIDLVGTPLVAFSNLVGAGDTPAVFNGTCGAESGWVPVSAISPDMLFSSLEIQRKEKAEARPPLLSRPTADASDSLGDSLLAELKRAQSELKLPEAPQLYYMRGHLLGIDRVYASASLGSLRKLRTSPVHQLAVEVRVGDADFDNTGFGGWETGRVRGKLPIGADGGAVRRVAWSLADGAYKNAVEQFARKEAAFEPPPDHPGDFEIRRPTIHRSKASRTTLDVAGLTQLTQDLSAAFPLGGALELGQVDLVASEGEMQIVDTLGTDVTSRLGEIRVRAAAHARASDGMLLTDQRSWAVADAVDLPEQNVLRIEVEDLADELAMRATAPRFEEEYVGPVLFEGEAVLELFRSILFGQLEGSPAVLPFDTWLGEMGQGMFSGADSGDARLGRRVLPPGWGVVDDPGTRPGALGGFTHDAEGTPAQRVELVQDGIVTGVVMSRIPRQGQISNGHARGALGRRLEGRMSQVVITPAKSVRQSRLRKKAVRAARPYGRDYVLVVRRFQDDGVRSLDNAAPRVWRGEEDAVLLPMPVEVVRWYRDGREEVLRGAGFVAVNRWVLRDVMGAGALVEGVVFSAWDNGGRPESILYGMPIWLEAPSVLVGEMEVVPVPPDPRRVRRIPPPN